MRVSSTDHFRSSRVDSRVYHKRCLVQPVIRPALDDASFVIDQDEVTSIYEREVSSKGVNLMRED